MTIDRRDPEIAARILGELCPDIDAQRCWARYALQSVDIARSISSDTWEITLHADGVRLNVGQIAVLELWVGRAVFYSCAPALMEPPRGIRRQKDWNGYRAVRVETDRWYVDVRALPRVPSLLIEKHLELIRLAALAKKVSPFRAAHSTGLLTYLQELAGTATRVPERPLENVTDPGVYPEGALRTDTVDKYERNEAARLLCIQHYGAICAVCALDFGAVYGAVARGFIHVHHLKALSEIGAEYEVDPIADLRPVCPNCHAVIHLGGQTHTIEDVRKLLETARGANQALRRPRPAAALPAS